MSLSYSEHAQRIISALDLKHKSGSEYGDRPCPNCGGTDRFWIADHQGRLVHHCRKDCNFTERHKALQRDGIIPVEDKQAQQCITKDHPGSPYHVRKGIELQGTCAVCDGDTVVIKIIDIRTNEYRGKQYIKPNGSKKFTSKLQKEGCGTFIGEQTDVLYVTEGWADAVIVHKATGKQALFALDAGNIPNTVAILNELGRNVVIAADSDKAGIEAARASGAPFVLPQGGKDWWDVNHAHGLKAVAEQLQNVSIKQQMQLFDHVLDINLEPPRWLIDGILPEYAMSAIVAPSYTGKSYVAVDMACAVANGTKWHDEFDVAHGNVFYVIGEGRFGIRRRVEAWHRDRGVAMNRKTTNLHFSRQGLNFRDKTSIETMKSDMRLVKNIKLIVVDTLARSFGGGNENAPQDMGEFINSCDELMHEFGATVLIVHHVGKDAQSGARGHSSFFGALDTSMTIKKFGQHDIQLICNKQKDAPEFEKLQFAFVTLGCADETPVLQIVPTAKTSNAAKLGKNEQLAMDTFNEATKGRPLQCRLHLEDWRSVFLKRHTGDTDKAKNDAFSRARRELVLKGFLYADDDYYSLGYRATLGDKSENVARQNNC